MATIFELAFGRVRQNGMTEREALRMIETFGRTGTGQTFDWDAIAPRLTNQQAGIIDQAAVGYLMARGLTASVPEPEPRVVRRDGKVLAMPRGDA